MPDIMTELWSVKDRLSQEARQDLKAYCKHVTNEARKKKLCAYFLHSRANGNYSTQSRR